jgi:GNAT superfamily N-acetyltransferase
MTTVVAIRKICSDDLDALFDLVQRFATSFSPDRAAFDETARVLLAQKDTWLAGAEASGRLVGYCLGFEHLTFYANGRVGCIEEIMVAEPWRRRGVGRALTNGFEEWARSRGARLIGLSTRRAAPFYEALGYEESATYFRKVLHGSGR